MGARKLAAVFLLSIALLLPTGFCAWNQTVVVNVSDLNGLPLSGASILATYQKANGITGDDGLAEGYTGDDGIYTVNISNTVPAGMENRKIALNTSFGGWTGEQKTVEASADGSAIVVSFVAPVTLEKVTIIVLQPDGKAAAGATVYITGSPIKRTADSSGRAVVYMPEGGELSGFASYQSEGDYFTSASATTGADGGKEILVRLPVQTGTGAAANKTAVSVKFISINNAPAAGEKVMFYADGVEVPSYTNALGIATVSVSGNGELRALLHMNDYDYGFSFNITADGSAKEETAVLAPLLKIEYFESKPDGPDCYILSAKVSDPRTSRPISIKIFPLQNGTPLSELPVSLDENGLYTVRVCAGANALVKAVASNAYETVEKTITLAYTPPPPPVQANATGNGTLLPIAQTVTPTSPIEGVGAAIIAIVLLIIVFGGAVMVLGKKSPDSAGGTLKYFTHTWGTLMGSTVRPIIEYLHSLIKKKEPPRGSIFYQPPGE